MTRTGLTVALLLAGASTVFAPQATDAAAPEAATAPTAASDAFGRLDEPARAAIKAKADGTPIQGTGWMVSAAHPLAVESGARVLAAGGSAADAMVAVQVVLGLVEA